MVVQHSEQNSNVILTEWKTNLWVFAFKFLKYCILNLHTQIEVSINVWKNHVMESNYRKQKHIETKLINNECTWFKTLNTKLVFGKVHLILH